MVSLCAAIVLGKQVLVCLLKVIDVQGIKKYILVNYTFLEKCLFTIIKFFVI